VKWNDPKINHFELNEMLQDLWSSSTLKSTHLLTLKWLIHAASPSLTFRTMWSVL
jgi:hypothetical protein